MASNYDISKIATHQWCYDNFGRYNSSYPNKGMLISAAKLYSLTTITNISDKLITQGDIINTFTSIPINITAHIPYAKTISDTTVVLLKTATIIAEIGQPSLYDMTITGQIYGVLGSLIGGETVTYNFTITIPQGEYKAQKELSVHGNLGGIAPTGGLIPVGWDVKMRNLSITIASQRVYINGTTRLWFNPIGSISMYSGIFNPTSFDAVISNARVESDPISTPGAKNYYTFTLTLTSITPTSGINYTLTDTSTLGDITFTQQSNSNGVVVYRCLGYNIVDDSGRPSKGGSFKVAAAADGYSTTSKELYVIPIW